jgi:carboxymethylenebutenolidase
MTVHHLPDAPLSRLEIGTADGRTMIGELALPPGPPRGAVLVVHELFGLTDHLRDVARRLSDAGYVGVALDLFSHRGGRVRCLMAELGRMLVGRGPGSAALDDLAAAGRWLSSHAEYAELPTAVIGFCWGGGLVLSFVTGGPDVDAVAAFYGRNPPLDEVGNIGCPVLAVYGATDRFVTPGAEALRAAMEREGKSFEVHVVPGVGHSFMNERRRHDPAAVAGGWRILLDFLDRHLASPG